MALRRVFEPIRIGNVEVPNRIVRTAHDTGFAKPDIGEDFIAYHAARAKGGCGLSILEAARVHPSTGLDMQLYGDAIIPGLQRLMSAVRPHGMRVFQQLWHGGNTYPAANGGPPWAVSDIPGYWGVVGRPMSLADILELKRAFVSAALTCLEGGLDGVELHGCHGYIFHQFLSPFYNNREDAYGGSVENRSRFLFETAREVRAAVGANFVVGIRLGASELPGGITEADNQQILRQLQAEKLIDFVDLSVGDYYRFDTMTSAMHSPSGYELPSSAQIGSVASVPRIVTGRIRTLEEAEEVLRSGKAELVSMVRAQIADPELVRKTRDSSAEDVRPCIACNQGCIGGLFRSGRMGCAVNPAVGVETVLDETAIPRSAAAKQVLVIGGGPGGMEAARIAALAGHKVILAEAQNSLGGALNIARLAPRLQTIGDIAAWLDREVNRLGVEVRLGTYMEAQDVRAVQADVVIVATGSTPRRDGFQLANPSLVLKGRELPHVISTHELLLEAKAPRGASAVVLDTVGHYEALAAMEFLLQKGLFVTYVTHALSLTPAAHATWRDLPALERFYGLGEFEILLRHEMLEVNAAECIVRPLQAAAHQSRSVRADTVVLITPNAPLCGLYDELREDTPCLHLIGDALSPRDVQVAIAEGHRTARAIA